MLGFQPVSDWRELGRPQKVRARGVWSSPRPILILFVWVAPICRCSWWGLATLSCSLAIHVLARKICLASQRFVGIHIQSLRNHMSMDLFCHWLSLHDFHESSIYPASKFRTCRVLSCFILLQKKHCSLIRTKPVELAWLWPWKLDDCSRVHTFYWQYEHLCAPKLLCWVITKLHCDSSRSKIWNTSWYLNVHVNSSSNHDNPDFCLWDWSLEFIRGHASSEYMHR